MPVPKKRTISTSKAAKAEPSPDQKMPDAQEFRQRMRTLAVSAMRVLIEEVMREELEQCLGAAWGEITPERKGYRNGSYPRDLVTKTGRIEGLSVPRDREGVFHSQVFERSNRYEPEGAQALTEMFVSGTSTHKVGKVAQTLTGVAPSASAVSRLNQTLTEQFETWRERRLQEHWRILYLDGIHFSVRHGDQTDSTIILTALGVDLEGNKEVLALRACAEEDKDGWMCLVQDLRTRGVTRIDLMVTDGHDGLLAAVASLFPATPRQRCVVHKERSAHECHSQTRAQRGHCRVDGDLEITDQRGGTHGTGGLQRKVPEALSRSGPQADGGRRASAHLFRLSPGHASLHSHDQRHRKLFRASFGSELTRLIPSPPKLPV